MSDESKVIWYDPPLGWMYGFPLAYRPLPNEDLKATLIRDGYPEKMAEMGSKHCRFIGRREQLEELLDRE